MGKMIFNNFPIYIKEEIMKNTFKHNKFINFNFKLQVVKIIIKVAYLFVCADISSNTIIHNVVVIMMMYVNRLSYPT